MDIFSTWKKPINFQNYLNVSKTSKWLLHTRIIWISFPESIFTFQYSIVFFNFPLSKIKKKLKNHPLDIMNPFKCSREILIDKANGLLQLMSSNNRVYSIHTCLKPRRYHSWLLWYLLEATPVLGKYSKFEKMCDCNCSFVIEKDPFVEWVTATGMVK